MHWLYPLESRYDQPQTVCPVYDTDDKALVLQLWNVKHPFIAISFL